MKHCCECKFLVIVGVAPLIGLLTIDHLIQRHGLYYPYAFYHLIDENYLSLWRFQDFAFLEPIATFMCSPFREDVEVHQKLQHCFT